MSDILEVRDAQFYYGEINALRGVSLRLAEGEIVTLLGGNGAGKTTTLRMISGLVKGLVSGEIVFMGERINGRAPHRIAAMGIAQCLEGRHIYSQLTVRENLLMGAYLRKGKGVSDTMDYVYSLFPRLLEREKQQGGTLSGGEQQMLAVGRALMQQPKMLMMDEPSLGLAPLVIAEIFRTIRKINEDGIPILLVEQNSNAALQVAQRGYVLENGEILMEDSAQGLAGNEHVRKSYLGAN